MENLEKSILELIPGENQERAKELINKLKLDAVEEFKKSIFKGREKKYHLTNETREIIEKYINKELKTKEILEVLGVSKASFFRMLKEYKGYQVEEPKEIIKEQENQEQENYKTCNICKAKKPLSEFTKNGFTKLGIQRYRPTCKDCN